MCAELFNREIKDSIQVPMVWLCPNCHAYVHKAMKHHNFNNLLDILREQRFSSITDEEVKKIKELSSIPSKFAIEIAKGLDDFSDPVLEKYGVGK
jgi:Zn-finger protein